MSPLSASARRRMCSDKRRWSTWLAATFFAKLWLQRAYHCPICHEWHLTNDLKRPRKSAPAK